MFKTLISIFACSLVVVAVQVAAQGDPEAGKQKAQVCGACHGPDGNSSNGAWPKLAGQNVQYIRKQLHDFKSGKRSNPQMAPMAAPLSDQDIEDIAAYYSSQDRSIGKAEPRMIIEAETLYRAGSKKSGLASCMACHGPSGTGNPAAVYPALSGQHATYTASTLKEFRAETRNNDQAEVMRSIARKLSNDEIDALANYIQGLH